MYLLYIAEFHLRTSTRFSESFSKTCTCNKEIVLGKHAGSNGRCCKAQLDWCTIAMWLQPVQIGNRHGGSHNVAVRKGRSELCMQLEAPHLHFNYGIGRRIRIIMHEKYIKHSVSLTFMLLLGHWKLDTWYSWKYCRNKHVWVRNVTLKI